jgi:hypothetical protein
MDERAVALRPVQLFALGLLTYGLVRMSWPSGLAGLGLLAYDIRREPVQPEFAPLDLMTRRVDLATT